MGPRVWGCKRVTGGLCTTHVQCLRVRVWSRACETRVALHKVQPFRSDTRMLHMELRLYPLPCVYLNPLLFQCLQSFAY